MPDKCFFCGLAATDEFPSGDACGLCGMMHDVAKRDPEILDDDTPVYQIERLYTGFTYPIM